MHTISSTSNDAENVVSMATNLGIKNVIKIKMKKKKKRRKKKKKEEKRRKKKNMKIKTENSKGYATTAAEKSK